MIGLLKSVRVGFNRSSVQQFRNLPLFRSFPALQTRISKVQPSRGGAERRLGNARQIFSASRHRDRSVDGGLGGFDASLHRIAKEL